MVQSLPPFHPFTLSLSHRKMMHEAALRVLLVALGLFLCPRDDPGLPREWDSDATMGLQRQEKELARQEEELEKQSAPVGGTTTDSDGGPQADVPDKYDTESVSEAPTVSEPPTGDVEGLAASISDPGLSGVELVSPQMTSQAHQEEQGKLNLSRGLGEDAQTSQEKPEVVAASLPEVHSGNETSDKGVSEGQHDFLWIIWNTFSIISMVHFFGKHLRNTAVRQDESGALVTGEVSLPDSDTLQVFHSQCVQASSRKKWRDGEFLEGFANHMVEAMQVICAKEGGMVLEACQMLDSRDIIVPLTPSEPYSFQCRLWNGQASELGAQIKLVEKIQNGCPCNSANVDNMVCLLHDENDKVKKVDIRAKLCFQKTAFLSMRQVTRWFQSTIKQAWAHISHKYDFELSVRYMDAPGALLIRFRSGKKLVFSLSPVVKFNKDTHFFISPSSPKTSDTCWTMSLTVYEDQLLERLSKHLPPNSCHIQVLDIASFLHRRQVALSGSSAVKCGHFKTTLLHLLLKSRQPAQWGPDHMSSRLRELLVFMQRSLQEKMLRHVLIGNPLTAKMMQLPSELTQRKPVNLFHPLVVESCIYKNASRHFQEILQNANMLIHDYVKRT